MNLARFPGRFRPYDLVIITHDCPELISARKHIGQVISYPDEDFTIQVRMIPEDPCSMQTLSLSEDANPRIMKKVKGYRWVQFAEVHGVGAFPVDMLRRENSQPVNFTLDDENRPVMEDGHTRMIIAKVTQTRSPFHLWNHDRWASFSHRLTEKTPKRIS